MDASAKEEWKWKFYSLTLHLNAIIFFLALTIMALLKVPEPFRILSTTILLILDLILVFLFMRRYAAAKVWLDEHSSSKMSG